MGEIEAEEREAAAARVTAAAPVADRGRSAGRRPTRPEPERGRTDRTRRGAPTSRPRDRAAGRRTGGPGPHDATPATARPDRARGARRGPRRGARGPGLARSAARGEGRACSSGSWRSSRRFVLFGAVPVPGRGRGPRAPAAAWRLPRHGRRPPRLDGPVRRLHALPLEPRVWFLGSGPSAFGPRWREALIHRIGGLLPVWRGGVGVDKHVAAARAVVGNGAVLAQMPEGTVSGPAGTDRPVPDRRGADRAADGSADRPARHGRDRGALCRPADGRPDPPADDRPRSCSGDGWDGRLPPEGIARRARPRPAPDRPVRRAARPGGRGAPARGRPTRPTTRAASASG